MRALVILVTLTGCKQLLGIDDPTPGLGADAATNGIVLPTDGPNGDGGTACYGNMQGLFRPCFAQAPSGSVTLSGPLNTDSDSRCAIMLSGATEVCVIAGGTITINGGLRGVGSRPLVLVAATTLDVPNGASINVSSNGTDRGAGGAFAACATPTAPMPSTSSGLGGGAGGSFQGSGGSGGAAGIAGTQGIPAPVSTPTSVRGGCSGGLGLSVQLPGTAGRGGGAVYLIAGTALTLAGTINASGAGAQKGDGSGNGAGSGGLIGIDAKSIVFSGTLFANGGGGSGGTNAGVPGSGGESPGPGIPANGGSSSPGDGGQGSFSITLTGVAGQSVGSNQSGGGGGGGAGWIVTYGVSIGSTTSVAPPAQSP